MIPPGLRTKTRSAVVTSASENDWPPHKSAEVRTRLKMPMLSRCREEVTVSRTVEQDILENLYDAVSMDHDEGNVFKSVVTKGASRDVYVFFLGSFAD